MHFVVRADASTRIGTGHVMRCLTLAEGLRERGSSVSFVCREHEGNLCGLIESRGFSLDRLRADAESGLPGQEGPAHADWLGSSWETDAAMTRLAIERSGITPDWLIVDHYALDARWERAMRPSVSRIMVIDDLADRGHDCDLLLDQNLVAGMLERYSQRVSNQCGLLLGPENALLQPVYADLQDRTPLRAGPIERMMVYFGGADQNNLTGRILRAFLELKREEIHIDVVHGDNSPHAESIRSLAAGHRNVHLHSRLRSLAPLMVAADLAIGAGGATTWERLCLGLPALVITLAQNQTAIAQHLDQKGLIRWLGHQDQVDDGIMFQSLHQLTSGGLDESWSRACRAVTDGRGLGRVCEALLVTADTPLEVRHAKLGDEMLLLEWANDRVTRENAFSTAPIPASAHKNWFRKRLRDLDGCQILIVQTRQGLPVGQVRFDRHDQFWEIDYSLSPVFRGRRLGARLLGTAVGRWRSDHPGAVVRGKVKKSNRPSQRIFESLGFQAVRVQDEDFLQYQQA